MYYVIPITSCAYLIVDIVGRPSSDGRRITCRSIVLDINIDCFTYKPTLNKCLSYLIVYNFAWRICRLSCVKYSYSSTHRRLAYYYAKSKHYHTY